MNRNIDIKAGSVINNDDLCSIFCCSPQGGMRRSHKTQTLVIVSNHIKSIYDDRWIDKIFHYTGMGREGDQSLQFAQNETLSESNTNGVAVHLFEVFEDKKYTYIGQVRLFSDPYEEIQPDINGKNRKVWMFPLQLVDRDLPAVDNETIIALSNKKAKKARKLTDQELEKRVRSGVKKPGSRKTFSTQYERSPWVVEYAKRRAKGICQLCRKPAPFKSNDGSPYLETHHIVWLAKGGEDTIKNTVALCPNCHRKMHVVNSQEDIDVLIKSNKGINLIKPSTQTDFSH